MRSLVFDTSSIISIATNNLLWIMKPLKDKFKGEFFISDGVKKEVVDIPMKIKKYKLEAMRLADAINKGDFKSFKNVNIDSKVNSLLKIANNIFRVGNDYIHIVDKPEIEGLVLASTLNAEAYVVDERTIRLLVEDPGQLLKLFSRKLHAKIGMNRENLSRFQSEIKNVRILRSVELMTVAFELGLLDKYKDSRKDLLDGVLWGLKLRGCSVSGKEIEEILQLERFK